MSSESFDKHSPETEEPHAIPRLFDAVLGSAVECFEKCDHDERRWPDLDSGDPGSENVG